MWAVNEHYPEANKIPDSRCGWTVIRRAGILSDFVLALGGYLEYVSFFGKPLPIEFVLNKTDMVIPPNVTL